MATVNYHLRLSQHVLRDAASSGIRSCGSGRPRHGPPELGAYVAAGELCFCRRCAEAIRPPAYVATVLGMTGREEGDARSSAEVLGGS
jgi:hypothetical protein